VREPSRSKVVQDLLRLRSGARALVNNVLEQAFETTDRIVVLAEIIAFHYTGDEARRAGHDYSYVLRLATLQVLDELDDRV
jgi:hypothetical protein